MCCCSGRLAGASLATALPPHRISIPFLSACGPSDGAVRSSRASVAERGGGTIADPLPHGSRAAQFGLRDELGPVQFPGLEADRADQVLAARPGVPVE